MKIYIYDEDRKRFRLLDAPVSEKKSPLYQEGLLALGHLVTVSGQ